MVAIDLITQHIRVKLQQPDLRRIYHNLEVVPSNYQTRGMHTIIRDVQTNKADFVFYADRLLRLVRASAAEALVASSSFAAPCIINSVCLVIVCIAQCALPVHYTSCNLMSGVPLSSICVTYGYPQKSVA